MTSPVTRPKRHARPAAARLPAQRGRDEPAGATNEYDARTRPT